MEMRNRMDEEIRRKLENLEAEPSAKVWMNIRNEVSGKKRGGGFYIWGMAAAAAMLLLFVGYFTLKTDSNDTGMHFAQFLLPHSIDNNDVKEKQVPNPDKKIEILAPVPQNQFADKPQIKQPVIQKETPDDELKIEHIFKPSIPDPIADEPKIEIKEDVIIKEELIQNPLENSIAQSTPVKSAKEKKSSSPLKVIAKVGRDLFGMKMGYKEDLAENSYKFHADLGFMKIDRTGGN